MIYKQLRGYGVYVYDPLIQGKKHVGTFRRLEDATRAEARATRFAIKVCVACGRRFRPDQWNQTRCVLRCGVQPRNSIAETDDHWVYYCEDTAGKVLYVGLTSTGLRRHKRHGQDKPWWRDVATVRIRHFATRTEAARVEVAEIQRLAPPHNVLEISGADREAVA